MNHNPSTTDAELDRDWQPNGRRPQSTIARSFSQELMDIFKIEGSLTDLDQNVDKRVEEKKQQVTTQTTELEKLEQRIKEMEERLKRSQPTGQASTSTSQAPRQGNTFSGQTSAATPVHGGAMPPTPTASEGEYHHDVDHDEPSPLPATPPAFTPLLPSNPATHLDHGLETRSVADLVIVSKDGGDRDL